MAGKGYFLYSRRIPPHEFAIQKESGLYAVFIEAKLEAKRSA